MEFNLLYLYCFTKAPKLNFPLVYYKDGTHFRLQQIREAKNGLLSLGVQEIAEIADRLQDRSSPFPPFCLATVGVPACNMSLAEALSCRNSLGF